MVPPAHRRCESCVLDWKWFSETVPGAHMPRGNLFLLSLHVLPAAHNGSKHSMKKQLVDTFLQVDICVCLWVRAWLGFVCSSTLLLMYKLSIAFLSACVGVPGGLIGFISPMLISVSTGRTS